MKLDVAVGKVAVGNVAIERVAVAENAVEKMAAGRVGRAVVGILVLGIALGVSFAGSALALDGIDLSQPVEATAPGECPRLIQIKYPFLRCEGGIIGLADGDATWENTRQIPTQGKFNEGNGFWGDEMNRE